MAAEAAAVCSHNQGGHRITMRSLRLSSRLRLLRFGALAALLVSSIGFPIHYFISPPLAQGLSSTSAAWTNNSPIPGWFHARTGTGATAVAAANDIIVNEFRRDGALTTTEYLELL